MPDMPVATPAFFPPQAPVASTANTPATPTAPVQQSVTPNEPPATPPAAPSAPVQQSVGGQSDWDAMANAVADRMSTEFRNGLAAVNDRINQNLRPTSAPWVGNSQQGGNAAPAIPRRASLGSSGYSYWRTMQAIAHKSWDQAPGEYDLHQRLEQAYSGFQGFQGGALMPLSSQLIGDIDSGLARECHELAIAGVTGLDAAEVQQIARERVSQGYNGRLAQNLSIYDDTYLGVFISFAEAGEMISLLRPMEIFSSIGARQVQFLPNGTFPMLRHTGAMTAYWVGQGRTDDARRLVTKSTPRTGAQQLTAKKLGCAIDIPVEFTKYGAASTEAFIRMDIADTMAQELDQSLYSGAGTAHEPLGIIYSGILTYEADLPGSDGDFFQPQDLEYMVATIGEQNVRLSNPTFITRPMLAARIQSRRADAISAMDQKGPYVALDMPYNAFLGGDRNRSIGGYPLVKSTTVPNNIAKGVATNLSQVLCIEPSEVLIARMGVIEFNMTDSDGTNFRSGIRTLLATQYVDGAIRRAEAACLCSYLIQDDAVWVVES